MLNRARTWLVGALSQYTPWTNVYGLARSIIALATAATLMFNSTSILIPSPRDGGPAVVCDGLRGASAFCVAPSHHLNAARWICVAVLLIVASGWRPRWTALLHWWIAFSVQASITMLDGGDQVVAVLALLLLPIALTDDRAWHWQTRPAGPPSEAELHRRLLAWFGHALIRLQIAGIYFHAFIGKLTVPEWKDGTAMFYWGTHETFGAPRWLEPIFHPILVNGWSVAALTWSVVFLEILLSVAMFMDRKYQRVLMFAGMSMHFGIIFVHGLPTFGSTMIAALLLYLRPLSQPISWPSWLSHLRVARWMRDIAHGKKSPLAARSDTQATTW